MYASPPLPSPRGPISEAVVDLLAGRSDRLPDGRVLGKDVLVDDDVQLALTCCYELHYRGFDVPRDLEWDPALLAFRGRLEAAFERELRAQVPRPRAVGGLDPAEELQAVIAAGDGPSVSSFMERDGQRWHLAEFAVHRSIYQLKEADAHTWGIPRYAGRSRAALIEIQMDEYGEGRPGQAHADLFADTMSALGLDPTYGAYLDEVPGVTLATTNLISFFGLHRRLLPALLGHLALFENTSVEPMGRYARACDRLGLGERARRFYDVHVAADEHHGPLAARHLVGDFVADHPGARADVMWGAACVMELEGRLARHLMGCWEQDRTSLLRSVGDPPVARSDVVAVDAA
jgi:hypothetical protein